MKSLILFFIIFLNLTYAKELTFGVDDTRPFHYFDKKGNLKGPTVSFFKEITKRTKIKFKIKKFPQVRLSEAVRNKGLDGTFGLLKTKERQEKFIFSNESIFKSLKYYVVFKRSENIKNFDDILNSEHKICYKKGHFYPRSISKSKMSLLSGVSLLNLRLLKLLELNRCKFVLASSFLFEFTRKQDKKFLNHTSHVVVPNFNLDVHTAFGKHVKKEIVNEIDKTLNDMKKEGLTYEYYYNKYWSKNR